MTVTLTKTRERESTRLPNSKVKVVGALIRVFGEPTPFFVESKVARSLPRQVYWNHTEDGMAVGPDGAPLGLWANEEFVAREIRNQSLGGRRHFTIEDLVFIDHHYSIFIRRMTKMRPVSPRF